VANIDLELEVAYVMGKGSRELMRRVALDPRAQWVSSRYGGCGGSCSYFSENSGPWPPALEHAFARDIERVYGER
jgi:hypothetical protein